MRINVIGTRGFPNVPGGVERHCESIYYRIASKECTVTVFRRKRYIKKIGNGTLSKHITFKDIYSPKNRNLETLVHSITCALCCIVDRPDLIHIHNIGPALVLPLLKLFKVKTVVTYHSKNYQQEKWGYFAKKVLVFGEKMAFNLADKVIFVSINEFKNTSCLKKIHIPNGVELQKSTDETPFLNKIGLLSGEYILFVGRFVPEKGIVDLINSYKKINCKEKLVLAGDADHTTEYSKIIYDLAKKDSRIILTGYITGNPLNELYSNTKVFVLPSHNEGFPIVLLEALNHGVPVLASNIQANMEVADSKNITYFKTGSILDLARKLRTILIAKKSCPEKREQLNNYLKAYNWDTISKRTLNLYREIIESR